MEIKVLRDDIDQLSNRREIFVVDDQYPKHKRNVNEPKITSHDKNVTSKSEKPI